MNKLFLFLLCFGYIVCAQHQDKVDFLQAAIFIEPIPLEKKIKGSVTYEFEILKDIDSVFLDAHHMIFSSVLLDEKKKKFENTNKKIILYKKFKKGEKHFLTLDYSCQPKQTVYFSGWDDAIDGNEQIWTQGQGKYTSHWLPSFDDMLEKTEFDLSIVVDSQYNVISNGILETIDTQKPNHKMWSFDMKKPMSSYLLAFAIGNYEKQELKSKSSISIENYYYPQDSLKVEPTYRYTKEIFDFLEEEIGFAYPWQNYKQIPVHDFLYAGMENTTATIFSDQYVIDSTAFIDKNYVNVNAHELAHQWFGNLVTEKDGNHHWLHEGFATYYAYLTEQHLFGNDHFYWKLYKTLNQLNDDVESNVGQALTNPKASSLTFYEKGAWALFMLQNEVGDKAFKLGVKNYLEKFQFKNVTIDDFIKEVERASGISLNNFRASWLESTSIAYDQAIEVLTSKSKSIKLAFEYEKDRIIFQKGAVNYTKYWNATNSIHLKKHILESASLVLPQEILDQALEDSLEIKQKLISVIDDIKKLNKVKVEALLTAESYSVIETSLLRLWQAYPEDRPHYLNKTQKVLGLTDKNVRLLWLTLAMLTENYNSRQTKVYFDELSAYTSSKYSFEIRQSAFFYLKQVFGFNDESLINLIKASEHHAWQFKKFARNLLQELIKDSDYKVRIQELTKELNSEEYRYLITELNKE